MGRGGAADFCRARRCATKIRKAQVITAVKDAARANTVPEPLVAALWEMLVESSIAYEMALFDAGERG